MPDLAAKMVNAADIFVENMSYAGVTWLEVSPDSVLRLDDLIDQFWPPGARPDDYQSMIPVIGAYVGEVLIRETGATWVEGPHGIGVTLRGQSAFPLNKVAKRFDQGRNHSIGHFFREIRAHWLSGHTELPATWRASSAPSSPPSTRGLRLPWRRGTS